MQLINKIKAWFRKRSILSKCGCICFCPNCGDPLNDVKEPVIIVDGDVVYTCQMCGRKQMFDFESAPVPIYKGEWSSGDNNSLWNLSADEQQALVVERKKSSNANYRTLNDILGGHAET